MPLLPQTDLETITNRLNRPPNPVEVGCFLNIQSEHCSYRSSAKRLRRFPTDAPRVLIGIGDNAATGRGGIIRHILSMIVGIFWLGMLHLCLWGVVHKMCGDLNLEIVDITVNVQ